MFSKWKYLFYIHDSIYAIKKQIKNERRKQNLSERNIKLVIAEKPSVAQSFAKIVDYKSPFTSRHSIGVAEKASMLAKYMGYDSVTVQKMYLAGALHDIGKMAVGNEILEKPDAIYENRGCFRQ